MPTTYNYILNFHLKMTIPVKLLNECVNEITEWCNSNSLKLNPEEKIKIIYITSKFKKYQTKIISLQ